jgi:AraC-like DNA-binding protein
MPLAMSLVMPAGYLYVRQTLERRPLGPQSLIHLSIFVIYAVDMIPFFFTSAEHKRELLQTMDLNTLGLVYPEGWFMPTFGHFILRYVVFTIYLVLDCRLSLRMERKHRVGASNLNRPQRNWIRMFVFSQFLLMITPVFFLVNRSSLSVLMAMDITGLAMLSFQMYYLLFHPEVLYGDGFRSSKTQALPRMGNATVRIVEKVTTPRSADGAGEISARLEDHMTASKPYLRPGYKLRDLADETGISMARLSAHINKNHGTNFSGYLNELRIEHAIGKMRDNEHRMKTLEAIAEESGFQNRITFIRAFKKSKGMIPSRFLEGDKEKFD